MIQEQISTSSPKCLDGNAGFGVVAQTAGMSPNVARDIGQLSGYSHLFPAGDTRNPVAFLHVIRRSGGMDRHVISRVADCGNDYSGRTNRIGHHWIIEESDIPSLLGGSAAIASQQGIFRTAWNEKSQELPRGKQLSAPQIAGGVCRHWHQRLGDAGWGGVVAERIEQGDPVSIVFEPGTNTLPLLVEAFALLPPAVRWATTFSTFFLKSQEPPGASKIQIKCIAVGSDEMAFAKLGTNTLLIDLRQPPTEQPSGKYVEWARTGVATKLATQPPVSQSTRRKSIVTPPTRSDSGKMYDVAAHTVPVPGIRSMPSKTPFVPHLKKQWDKTTLLVTISIIVFLFATLSASVFGMATRVLKESTRPNKPPSY